MDGWHTSKGAKYEYSICDIIDLYYENFSRLKSIPVFRDIFRGKSLGSLERRQKLWLRQKN